ncbi:hypothetical protein BCR43DRAFT_504197 [Syncephalastrum racemosum]|uniref:F-box domain-containing protein n=1 Tax=Syncephalastrum racemosum TaxID=13706 RepID=A0A1X2HE97_SYNRA|nr:hypothetical protein BCR43DRAFT_504197 [Syncephalastrum racemosum]
MDITISYACYKKKGDREDYMCYKKKESIGRLAFQKVISKRTICYKVLVYVQSNNALRRVQCGAEGNYDLAIDYIGETLQHLVYQRLWKRRALNDYKGALEDAWMLHALDDKNTSYCLLVCELLEARCDTVGLRRAYDTFSVKHPELFMRKKRDLQARFRARRVDFVARLPREAAYLIMNQLLSSEKSVCYNVSKIWRSIMTDWLTHYVEDFSHRIHRADFAVDLNETPLYLMRDIIYNSARHLTRLCFYDVRLSSSGAWWSDLFDNCPNLTDLSYIFSDSAVQDMRDELILARPTQLMYLRWHANVDLPFNDLLPFCPRLQRLHMDPLTTDTAMLEFFSNIKRWCPSIADLFLTEPMFEDTCPIDPKERLRLRLTVILSRAEPVKEFIVSHASEFSEISILRPENDALGDAFSESFQLEHRARLHSHMSKGSGILGN